MCYKDSFIRVTLCFFLPMILIFLNCTNSSQPEKILVSKLVINEVVSTNANSMYDENGKDYDWIELYNGYSYDINLKDYALSDDKTNPLKWLFSDYTLGAGKYEIVFASSKDIGTVKVKPKVLKCGIEAAYTWSDSKDGLGGHSFAGPWQYSKILDSQNGKKRMSVVFYLSDNTDTDLEWQHAELGVFFLESQNYTPYNEMVLRGYIEKDRDVVVKLNQTCTDDYDGWQYKLSGTGEETFDYVIPLNQADSMINTACIEGVVISPTKINDSTHLTITQILFRHSGYYFHTNFKLSSKGESLQLTNVNSGEYDMVKIPPLDVDISYGRKYENQNDWVFHIDPTPGKENTIEHFAGITEKVNIVTKGGFYSTPVNVSMTVPLGTTVFYTLDGSRPTLLSLRYTTPVPITKTTCIMSVAYKENEISGGIKTETYFINETTTLPIVSISVDKNGMFDPDTGMYEKGPNASVEFPYIGANFWDKKRELHAQIELFERDRSRSLKENFGLKIHGNWSRGADKKSFAVMFREKFGKSWIDYPLFPNHSELTHFKSFILRSGGDVTRTGLIRDGWNSSMVYGRELDYQKFRSVALFINGEYRGVYNIREKLNENYFTTNYGIKGHDIDLIKDFGVIQSGTSENYNDLIRFVRRKKDQINDTANYNHIKKRMDIYNFIDYMSSEIYFVNTDWPANNIKFWHQRSVNSKWKWILYDTDYMEDDYTFDMVSFATNETGDDWPNGPESTFLLRMLLRNITFKTDFVNRLATLLNTNFTLEKALNKLDILTGIVKAEIPRECERWKIKNADYQKTIDSLSMFASKRPAYVRKHINAHFALKGEAKLTLSSTHGRIFINGMDVGILPFSGIYFKGNPVTIEIVDAPGFKKWSDGNTEMKRVLDLTEDLSLSVEL